MFQKISVITVVLNQIDALKATLESVKKLKLSHLESEIYYIVLDGGSVDGCVDYCNSNLDVIDHFITEKDHGIYDAMNKSVKYAHDDSYLIWINAGDTIEHIPYVLTSENSSYDCLFCAVALKTGLIIRPNVLLPYNEKNCFPKSVIRHQGFFIKKSFFLSLGGYSLDVGLQADGLLMSKAILNGNFKILSNVVSFFNLDGVSNTKNIMVLSSYFKVINNLDFSVAKIILYQSFYIAKLLVKIILPDPVLKRVIGRYK